LERTEDSTKWFIKEKGKMIIPGIDESLRGKNISFQLVERRLVIPRRLIERTALCTFIKKDHTRKEINRLQIFVNIYQINFIEWLISLLGHGR